MRTTNTRVFLLALLVLGSAQGAPATKAGRTIEAEDLRADRSAGYQITQSASERFLQFIDRGSHLCYDDVDLTGIKSLEYRYAKGDGEPPRRFAVVAFSGSDFDSSTRVNLGEKITELTGGWETFRTERIGLSRSLQGRHRLDRHGGRRRVQSGQVHVERAARPERRHDIEPRLRE